MREDKNIDTSLFRQRASSEKVSEGHKIICESLGIDARPGLILE